MGFEVEAWIALAVLSMFGSDWIDLGSVKDFAALITLLVTALAYVLGILVDRAADTLLRNFEKTTLGERIQQRLSKNSNRKRPAKTSAMRMSVLHASEGMSRFLDYQRSRWRIARATVANLAIAGPLAAVYVEPGEGATEAAAREAREEAGVKGDVSERPFTRYRYPSTRNGESESLVSAFLLAVAEHGKPRKKDRHREQRWADAAEAVALLRAGREPEYAAEHERVVHEAVAELSGSRVSVGPSAATLDKVRPDQRR